MASCFYWMSALFCAQHDWFARARSYTEFIHTLAVGVRVCLNASVSVANVNIVIALDSSHIGAAWLHASVVWMQIAHMCARRVSCRTIRQFISTSTCYSMMRILLYLINSWRYYCSFVNALVVWHQTDILVCDLLGVSLNDATYTCANCVEGSRPAQYSCTCVACRCMSIRKHRSSYMIYAADVSY